MSPQPPVLVLTSGDEIPLHLLSAIPYVAGSRMEDIAQAAPQAEVIFHWSGSRDLLRSVFLACPQLRWVHNRSAGLDGTLFPELVASAVPLTNGSGVFSQSLGEFALAAVLFFAKDFHRMLRNQQAARWEQFEVEEISRQTAGIVGYGDIGRAVAWRLHAMGMQVLALKRNPPAEPDPLIAEFYKPANMAAMLARCDYVIAAAPLTPETHHMISDAAFAAMKPNAVVVNVGRGPVIDQVALLRALTEKKIRGAGLDVFEQEPIPPADPIWRLDNILISSHTADRTRTWHDEAMQFFVAQYERFRRGEPLKNIVEKRLGY
jgi:phosphoglycerate dehydrogenase-like enzyme